ncbi:unnamed protein product [Cuscuta epithymum]|uniref:Uncharacterized protein n=1 Tax=Cuscuta epithymum TaxID=186058 RepID=A0AAV0EC10_9ASTE|nr:unnamed protein product [Cuscuta epithymum]
MSSSYASPLTTVKVVAVAISPPPPSPPYFGLGSGGVGAVGARVRQVGGCLGGSGVTWCGGVVVECGNGVTVVVECGVAWKFTGVRWPEQFVSHCEIVATKMSPQTFHCGRWWPAAVVRWRRCHCGVWLEVGAHYRVVNVELSL